MAETLTIKDFKNMALPAVGAAGGLIAGKVAPNLLGLTGWKRTGAQVALGLGAYYVGAKVKNDTLSDAAIFLGIGIWAMALTEIIGKFIPSVALGGLEAYPRVDEASIYEVSANAMNNELPADLMERPALADGFSAYPDETSSWSSPLESFKY